MADELARLAREWLTKASQDIEAARVLSASPIALLGEAIYHCQQGAEKALKGWLAWRGVALVRTHDLVRLIENACSEASEFSSFARAAEILTPYVSAFRYPGLTDQSTPSRDEFDLALQHAQSIYDFVLSLLPSEAHPQRA